MGNYGGQIAFNPGASGIEGTYGGSQLLGWAATGIGDVNGDGIDDYLVTDPQGRVFLEVEGSGYTYFSYVGRGAAYVVFGDDDGPFEVNVSELDGTNGFALSGDGGYNEFEQSFNFNQFGRSAAGLGDLNGDGYADIGVVGQGGWYYGFEGSGYGYQPSQIAYVMFGRDGFDAVETVGEEGTADGFRIEGGAGIITRIANAGDVNGDGHDDILLTVDSLQPYSYAYYGGDTPVLGYVVFGGATLEDTIVEGVLDLDDIDGTNGFEIRGETNAPGGGRTGGYGEVGYYAIQSAVELIAAGDVNGDGFDDILAHTQWASAQGYYSGYYYYYGEGSGYSYGEGSGYYYSGVQWDVTQRGRLYEILGDASGGAVGGVAYADETLGGANVTRLQWGSVDRDDYYGVTTYGGFFSGYGAPFGNDFMPAVDGIGDVNGDGFDDVGVEGSVEVALGTASGLPDGYYGDPASLTVTDTSDGFGERRVTGFGYEISSAGDVNGDGIDDALVYARGDIDGDFGYQNALVYLVFGNDDPDAPSELNLDEDVDGLDGNAYLFHGLTDGIDVRGNSFYYGEGGSYGDAAPFRQWLQPAGDVNGDGHADFIIGAPNGFSSYAYGDRYSQGDDLGLVVFGGPDALEALDNADGTDDNVIDIRNLDVDVDTGIAPIRVGFNFNPDFFPADQEEPTDPESGPNVARFSIERTGDLTAEVSVDWSVGPASGFFNTAESEDFVQSGEGDPVFPSGTVTFAAGERTAVIEVPIEDDLENEGSEYYTLTLDSVSGPEGVPTSILGDAQTTAFIFDNDRPAEISVSDFFFAEGDGTVEIFFNRSGDQASIVDFDFEITSAVPFSSSFYEPADSDDVSFTVPFTGTGQIAAGEFSTSFSFDIVDDLIDEAFYQTLQVEITSVTATGGLGTATGVGDTGFIYIEDNDEGAELRVFGQNVTEGEGPLEFTIARSGDTASTIEVTYEIVADTFNAAESEDIVGGLPQGPLTVTIGAGETEALVEVGVVDDTLQNEPFDEVRLNILSATATDGTGQVTVVTDSDDAGIFDDDIDVVLRTNDAFATEGQTLSLTIFRSGDVTSEVEVDYRIVPYAFAASITAEDADFGTLTPADDDGTPGLPYEGTATFAAGETSKTITLETINDDEIEGTEYLSWELVEARSADTSQFSLETGFDLISIADNDFPVRLSVDSPITTEGGDLVFTVTRSSFQSDTQAAFEVGYIIEADTATNDDLVGDPLTQTGTFSFAAGELSKQVTISTAEDLLVEGQEQIRFALTGATSTDPGVVFEGDDAVSSGRINDRVVDIDITAASATEGTDDALRFLITRGGITDIDVSFDVLVEPAFSGANQASEDDIVGDLPRIETITFAADETSQFFEVPIVDDALIETFEYVRVSLVEGSGSSVDDPDAPIDLTDPSVTGLILSDDVPVNVSVSANRVEEGSGQPLVFTFTRTDDNDVGATVDYVFGSDPFAPAVTADDLVGGFPAPGSVFFAAGETTKTVEIEVRDDLEQEQNEQLRVSILSIDAEGFETTGTGRAADGQIDNDDLNVEVSIESLSADEDGGPVQVTIRRSGDTAPAIEVSYLAALGSFAGSAQAADLAETLPLTGTLAFASGETVQTFTLTPVNDDLTEAPELVELRVTDVTVTDGSVVPVVFDTSPAFLTIVDDDDPIRISLRDDIQGNEDDGPIAITFESLDGSGNLVALEQDVEITYQVFNVSLETEDISETLPLENQTVTMLAGQSSAEVFLTPIADSLVEGDERAQITILNAEVISGPADTLVQFDTLPSDLVVRNDDVTPPPPPAVTIRATTAFATEGDDLVYSVTRSGRTDVEASVDYTFSNSTTSDADFSDTSQFSGTLTFAPFQTVQTVRIGTVDDTLVESTEYGFLRLSNGSSPTSSAVLDVQSWQAWAYLYDNDDNIELRIFDDRVTEGNGQNLEFRVTRSGELDADVTVTVEITGLTADSDDVTRTLPYTETVTFAPNETVKIISLGVTDDTFQEPDEFVRATITATSTTSGFGIDVIDGVANGEIENDDLDVEFSVRANNVSEGGTLIFDIYRSGDLTGTDVVTYGFSGGGLDPAESGDVVGGLPQDALTVTFNPGQTRATVTLDTVEDAVQEGNEGVTLTITGATTTSGKTVTGIGAQATGSILNDDFDVRFDVRAANTLEDSGFLVYTVTRSQNTNVTANVTYTLSGALGDVVGSTLISDTLFFGVGETSKNVFVQPIADAIPEPDEIVTMTLSGATATGVNATGDGRFANGIILNDDETATITLSGGGSIVEGDTGVTPVTVTFTRTGDLADEASVTYTLAGSLDSQDIIGTVGTQNLTFGVGEAVKTVTVNVLGDTFPEARTETLSVTINNVGSSAGVPYDVNGSAFIAVRDDDARPPIVPTGFEADIFGDPHIVTLDGLTYSFMAVGEFILLETVPGAELPFQAQVRFEPTLNSNLVSVTTRMAVEVDGVTVEIDAKTKELLIDGEVTLIDPEIGALDITGDGTADVYRVIDEEGKETYFIVLNELNEQLMVGLFDAGFMNVCVFLDESRSGAVQGLMGNADGDDQNEFALRDGTPFAEEPEFDVLYGEFADSWRLDDPSVAGSTKTTVFTYEDGQDTSSFDNPNFPAADIDLDEVPADILAAARQAAQDAGIEGNDDPNDPDYNPVFEAAVLDFVFTGLDTGGATLAAEPTGNVATFVSAAPPTMFSNVGAVTPAGAASADIVEGDAGVTPVQFRFYRTDSTGTAMTVHYAISGVDLEDVANGSLTGTVAFGETDTETFLQVDVLGDLLTEDDEEIVVTITGVSDGEVGAATARVTVETDDFAPEAEDDTLSVDADETLQANVLVANPTTPDSDPDLDNLTVLAVNGTALGTDGTETVQLGLGELTINANGSVEYTPDTGLVFADGEVKSETFEYTIGDGNGGEDTAEVTVSIVSVGAFVANTGPDAVNDRETTTEGEAVVIDVLDNDTDDEDDDLSIQSFGTSSGGTITENADGTLTFTPTADPGIYSFEYTVTDGSLTDSATVTVTVEEAPEEPLNVIEGTPGPDNLTGTDARDVIDPGAGSGSILTGGLEADVFVFALEDIADSQRARHRLTDFDNAEDLILADGTVQVAASNGRTVVQIDNPDGGPNDLIYLLGEFSKAELNLQENTSLTDFLNGL